jgi:hypothetical protein
VASLPVRYNAITDGGGYSEIGLSEFAFRTIDYSQFRAVSSFGLLRLSPFGSIGEW